MKILPNFSRVALFRTYFAQLLVLGLFLSVINPILAQKSTVKRKAAFQGVCGTVVFKAGNRMPSPDRPLSKGQPVVREVLIYELTSLAQTEASDDGFYTAVRTKLIKTVKSGKDGTFCVSLPIGTYSVFVQEEKGLYANLFDGQNHIFPVTVQKNRRSTITFEITHQAVF